MTAVKRQVEKIRRRVGSTGSAIELTDAERAWMDERPERHIRTSNDGNPFVVLSYNPDSKADQAIADQIEAKVRAAGGSATTFLIPDDDN